MNIRTTTAHETIYHERNLIVLNYCESNQLCRNKEYRKNVCDIVQKYNYDLICFLDNDINFFDIEQIQNINIYQIDITNICNVFDISNLQNMKMIKMFLNIMCYGLHLLKNTTHIRI